MVGFLLLAIKAFISGCQVPPLKYFIHSLSSQNIPSVLFLGFSFFLFFLFFAALENGLLKILSTSHISFRFTSLMESVCFLLKLLLSIYVFLYSLSFAYFGSGDNLKTWPLLADVVHPQNRQGNQTIPQRQHVPQTNVTFCTLLPCTSLLFPVLRLLWVLLSHWDLISITCNLGL